MKTTMHDSFFHPDNYVGKKSQNLTIFSLTSFHVPFMHERQEIQKTRASDKHHMNIEPRRIIPVSSEK